eukprot:1103569-Rhodomonas_salina.1
MQQHRIRGLEVRARGFRSRGERGAQLEELAPGMEQTCTRQRGLSWPPSSHVSRRQRPHKDRGECDEGALSVPCAGSSPMRRFASASHSHRTEASLTGA